MRIVVTGAGGLVGRAIVAGVQEGLPGPHDVLPLGHGDLDITNGAAVVRKVRNLRPDLVFNCAVVGVDECERDPLLARAVNVDGPAALAEAAPAIVHFSSNYVFDGIEEKFYTVDDEPRPVNVYGSTKLDGERAVAARCPRALVVRSSWIFGPGKASFISTVHRRLAAGERVRAVMDVWASTTYVADLVEQVFDLVTRGVTGLHHIVNGGVCSNESFAREAARIAGADEGLIEPASTREVHHARRPRYTPLRTSSPLRDWRAALASFIGSDR